MTGPSSSLIKNDSGPLICVTAKKPFIASWKITKIVVKCQSQDEEVISVSVDEKLCWRNSSGGMWSSLIFEKETRDSGLK